MPPSSSIGYRSSPKRPGAMPRFPSRPPRTHLSDLANRVGNDQLKVIHEQKARLEKEIADWRKQAESIAQRQPRWKQLTALLDHAADLPVAAEVQPEAKAIEQNRSLLVQPRSGAGPRGEVGCRPAGRHQPGPRRLRGQPRKRPQQSRCLAHLAKADPGKALRIALRISTCVRCRRLPWAQPRKFSTLSGKRS